jgi:cation transport regulator ChaB
MDGEHLMPYEVLPERLRAIIPSENGQEMFRQVVNRQLAAGKTEAVAMASAWAALQRAGYDKNEDGLWVEKSSRTMLENKMREYNEKYGDKHGRVTMAMLQRVYDRGVGAYRTNPQSVRPNVTSPEQWAAARVNSFLAAARGAKAVNHDKDVHDEIDKTMPTMSQVHVPGAEWDYDDDMDDKGQGKKEPKVEKAEYQGRTVALDKPFRLPKGSGKKFGVYVKDGDRVKRVTFGDPNMEIRRDDPEARANFRARHSCDTATDKTSARYWSCRMWRADASVSELTKRMMNDDSFTTSAEAAVRSMEIGLNGDVHVHETADGQATYMPGASHEAYIARMAELGNAAYESDDEYEDADEIDDDAEMDATEPRQDLLERAISAMISTIMAYDVNKTSKILKLDSERRIAWGWASVSTMKGELVTDLQGDIITTAEMEKMADRFMMSARTAKAMHEGDSIGEVIHSFPLTNELAKAFGMDTDREGWIIGMKIYDAEVWDSFKRGELAGFSIGGKAKRTPK